ncbi:hypothetical protein HXX76_004627 [Chlamydomonas incerta]|uniref:Uncharacterized protein n=1 Tax=Chlamydomonas incerta TaxID=51695 RepID=A0A835TIY9_CHLIN|nr:hypothetical protein HXX76_004627 [Chlamydomonas incerta]|eukprot:KAG2439266.1 hypothetical protein HXX76_004627 [Chlamydomonas incerta]
MAGGGEPGVADEPGGSHKLTDFLATLVTYPALYIFATAASTGPTGGSAGGTAASATADERGVAGAGNGKGAAVLLSGARDAVTGLAKRAAGGAQAAEEQQAQAQQQQPQQQGLLLAKPPSGGGGGGGPVMGLAPEVRYRLSDFPEGRALVSLERWCREPVHLGLLPELWAAAREYGRGYVASGAAPPWLAGSLGPWLESFPDAAPPLALEAVVERAVADAREGFRAEADSISAGAGPSGEGGPAAVGWEGGLPLRRLAAAAGPNLTHISRQLQLRYRLSRGRTWLEFTQIFLGFFRTWLRLVAGGLGLAAVALRLLGSGATVLSGAVAFTVVFSIALSVLAAALQLGGGAADAIAMLLRRLAAMTESVSHRSSSGYLRQTLEGDLVGPRCLDPASFEELEELFVCQLAPRLRLRSRPDAARLAGDPLLLRCYDLRLVDGAGQVMVEEAEAVVPKFEPTGFFGLAPAAVRKAAAVLLLRLLAWKRVGLCCGSAESLKYVFVMGERGAGRATAFARLAQLPLDYKVPPSVPAEIRPIQRLPGAFAVLPAGLDADPAAAPAVLARAQHFADLSHGVFSALVYLVAVDAEPSPEALGPAVWQALAARRPLLLLVNKGIKLTEALRSEPRAVESRQAGWTAALHEGAARRGLEADLAAVLVSELRDTGHTPAGVAGPQQVRDWLAAALESATTR